MVANPNLVSQCRWTLNSTSQGNKRLHHMVDHDVSDESSVEAANEVGSRVPTGFTDKPGALKIAFTFNIPKGSKSDVDWHYLKRAQEIVAATRQYDGGTRRQWPAVRVSTVSENGNADGENQIKVELVALEGREM